MIRRALGWLGRAVLAVAVMLALLWLFGPYEPADLRAEFDESQLDKGIGSYLAWREAQVDGITAGVQKQVIWAGDAEAQTDWSVLYVHGFSATAQEVRPVPDKIANALEANLVLTRLQGHGRGSEAMAESTVKGWMADTAEALAVARKVGKRVLVISTSTGGTLVSAAATDPTLMKAVAGVVMISPNYAVNNPAAALLTLPAARYWLPLLAGERRSFEPLNVDQETYWTTEYPSVAVLPMAALVKAVSKRDLGSAKVPALFIFSDADQVVDAQATHAVVGQWGGPVTVWQPVLTANDDPFAHVIAGEIVSPDQTDTVVSQILRWEKGL